MVKPKLKVWVVFDDRVKFGDGRVQLLERGSAIERVGYRRARTSRLAMDPAASEFHWDRRYVLTRSGGAPLSSAEMIDWYRRLSGAYPIVSIEDGLGEADREPCVSR